MEQDPGSSGETGSLAKRLISRVGNLVVKTAERIFNDQKHVEQLIEENLMQADLQDDMAMEVYRRISPEEEQQNEFIALILARSICRKLEEDPNAMIEPQLLRLKQVLNDELASTDLYHIGLSIQHCNMIYRRL